MLRHSAVYSLVPIAANVIAIVMVAFYTDWLHLDEMGVSQIVDLFLALTIELLGVSALQGMVRYYFEHDDERDRNAVVSSVLLAAAGISGVVCVVGLFFADELRPVLLGTPTDGVSDEYLKQVLVLAFLLVPFQMTTQAGYRYLMIRHLSGFYTRTQISKMLLELGLKVWFVAPFGLGLGVKGMLLSVLVGEVFTSGLLSGWILKRVGIRFDWEILKPILVYSWPLVLASLCHLALQRSDLRLIELLMPAGLGFATAGIYGIGYRIGYIGNAVLLGPFLQVFLPWIYAVEDRREQEALISRVTTYALVFIGTASICLSVFAREAVLILDRSEGHQYEEAFRVVPFVSVAYVFWAVYRAMAETTFHVAKRTRVLAWYSFTALLTNVLLNLWMIPAYGAVGAAASTLVAYALLAALGEIGRYRMSKASLEYGRIARCLGAVGVGATAAILIDVNFAETGQFSVAAIGAKVAVLVFALGFLWRSVLTVEERRAAVATVRQRLLGSG